MAAASIHTVTASSLYTTTEATMHEINESLPIFRMLWFTMFLPLQLFPSSSSTLPGPHSHRREPLVLMHISAHRPLSFSHSFTS